MSRIPKTVAIKNAFSLSTTPTTGGGGGGGGAFQAGPLFLQPMMDFGIADAVYDELVALTITAGQFVYWYSIVIPDLTSFSIRAAPYVQADGSSPGQVRIAIAPADIAVYGPTISGSAVYSTNYSFPAGTRGYVPCQWDATALPWPGPYTVTVGIQNLGYGVIQTTNTVQAEIWNVNAAAAPIGSGVGNGGSGVGGLAIVPGWTLLSYEDFDTDYTVGSFGPATGDVPTEYSGTITVNAEGDMDANGAEGGTSRYSPTTVLSVSNGSLRKYLHYDEYPRVGGITFGSGQLYGRYAIRFKCAPVPGYRTVWMLWPDSESLLTDGGVSFPQDSLDGNVAGFMYRTGGVSETDYDVYTTSVPMSPDWHTCVVEWMPDDLKFYLDDVLIGHSTSRVPDTPMNFVIQTEANLGGIQPTAIDAGYVDIDWIGIWSPVSNELPAALSGTFTNPPRTLTHDYPNLPEFWGGGHMGDELSRFNAANVTDHGNGSYTLTATQDASAPQGWYSGAVSFAFYDNTADDVIRMNDYIQGTIKMPGAAGVWGALWMLKDTGGALNAAMEIDMVEALGYDYHTAEFHTHFGADAGFIADVEWTEWTTYGVHIKPTGVDYYVNGVLIGTHSPSDYADTRWAVIANLAIGGSWPGNPVPGDPGDDIYLRMEIASIKVWSP